MSAENVIDTVSAAAGAAVVVGAAMRSYWVRREARQRAAFERAVQQIVDASMVKVIRRQVEFERRQGKHLDRQDETLRRLRSLIEQRYFPPRAGDGETGSNREH